MPQGAIGIRPALWNIIWQWRGLRDWGEGTTNKDFSPHHGEKSLFGLLSEDELIANKSRIQRLDRAESKQYPDIDSLRVVIVHQAFTAER